MSDLNQPPSQSKKPKGPVPNLRTPDDQINAVEKFKLASRGVRGKLYEHFRDAGIDNIIEESEQLAKSHGIYLEYNRAKTGREKEWMYMIRVSIPGGGPLNRTTWRLLDELSQQYTVAPEEGGGKPSLRITTRQNIQFHWVKKQHVIDVIQGVAASGFYTLNGCGDNVRNVMGCPLSTFSNVYNANAMAHRIGEYFRLPAEPHLEIFAIDPAYLRTPAEHYNYGPQLLNRKFKIAFSAIHFDQTHQKWVPDNCVELCTNEVGVAPIWDPSAKKVHAFALYVGGGQGEKNGKPTFAALAQPFGVFQEADLLQGLDAIVKVHEQWGDRQNRHWARLKYVIHENGIQWYRDQVKALGVRFDDPAIAFDYGDRHLHHGWQQQPANGKWAYGAYIENGRIIDGENGRLKTMVRHIMEHYDINVMTTPNQDLLFTNIDESAKQAFEADLQSFGYGKRNGKAYSSLRLVSGACVGLPTCRLAVSQSEQFEPQLIDTLEQMGYGDMCESIGITGCERQCFRPATKTLGWIGKGPGRYMLKLGGSESGRHLGTALCQNDRMYLHQVSAGDVPTVCAVLFDLYQAERLSADETMGCYHQRVGHFAIIAHLQSNRRTRHLMEKTASPPYLPKEQ